MYDIQYGVHVLDLNFIIWKFMFNILSLCLSFFLHWSSSSDDHENHGDIGDLLTAFEGLQKATRFDLSYCALMLSADSF